MRKVIIGIVVGAMGATLVTAGFAVSKGVSFAADIVSWGRSLQDAKHAERLEKRTFPLDGLKELEIESHAGDIAIEESDVSEVQVIASLRAIGKDEEVAEKHLADLRWTSEIKGGTLKIASQPVETGFSFSFESGGLKLQNRAINFRVLLPKGAKLPVKAEGDSGDVTLSRLQAGASVSVGSGNIITHDVQGELEVTADSGKVAVNGGAGHLKVETGSGTVQINERAGTLTVETGSGDVTLQQSKANAPSISLETGSGDVEAKLSRRASWRFKLDASVGTIDNALPSSGEGPNSHNFEASTGSGNITIKANS